MDRNQWPSNLITDAQAVEIVLDFVRKVADEVRIVLKVVAYDLFVVEQKLLAMPQCDLPGFQHLQRFFVGESGIAHVDFVQFAFESVTLTGQPV